MTGLSEEEKKAIEYFKKKIKNKIPLYEETYIDGKPYRRNILQLETNFTEEQANKTEILLNLIQKQDTEINKLNNVIDKLVEELRYQVGMGQQDIFCYDICENKPKRKCTDEECRKCIKEYFMKEDK